MKIAVYTIALNEEQFVERWYESAKYADYVLIADTGSTDGTVEKARALGINVVPISIKPFRFEDARNASLAFLPDDIDLCISLDMDEVMIDGWREMLEKTTGTQISYRFTWSWKDDARKIPDYIYIHTKVHARHGYRWRGIVHEMPIADRNPNHTEEFLDDFEIYHYADAEKSRGQYIELLETGIQEEPYNQRYLLYYARELIGRGRKEEAAEYFKRYIDVKESKHPGELSLAYRLLSDCEPENAEELLLKSIDADHTRRESLIKLAVLYFQQERWQECFDKVNKALEITTRRLDYLVGDYAWKYLPYNLLAVSRHNKDLDKNSPTYEEDKYKMNVLSLIASEFDLFEEVEKEPQPEQVLYDVQ